MTDLEEKREFVEKMRPLQGGRGRGLCNEGIREWLYVLGVAILTVLFFPLVAYLILKDDESLHITPCPHA